MSQPPELADALLQALAPALDAFDAAVAGASEEQERLVAKLDAVAAALQEAARVPSAIPDDDGTAALIARIEGLRRRVASVKAVLDTAEARVAAATALR